jgi:hypothetical protein
MFAVNVIGMAMVTKSVLPLIRKAGDASHVGVEGHCRWLPNVHFEVVANALFPVQLCAIPQPLLGIVMIRTAPRLRRIDNSTPRRTALHQTTPRTAPS